MNTDAPNSPLASIRADAGTARLRLLRRAARTLLLAHRLAWIVAGVVAAVVVVALIDWFLRTPTWVRAGVLAAGVASVAWAVRTRLWPAWRFKPSLEDLALRLERSEQGRRLGLEGVLASGVSLGETAAGTGAPANQDAAQFKATSALARPVVELAHARLASMSLLGALRPARAMVAVLIAFASIVGLVALTSAYPKTTWIGARRVLLPFVGAEWPKRTAVADVTQTEFHPLGSALVLQAGLVRSSQPPASTRVEVRYALIDAQGQRGPTRRLPMTSQDRPVDASELDERGERVPAVATLFERLIEPGALVAAASEQPTAPGQPDRPALDPDATQIEYAFSTDDDETPARRIALITPPRVVSATARVIEPAYVPGRDPEGVRLDLGPGTDERAVLGGPNSVVLAPGAPGSTPARANARGTGSVPSLSAGVLAGSTIELELRFSKPIPSGADGPASPWPSGLPALGTQGEDLRVSADPRTRLAASTLTDPASPAASPASEHRAWRLDWTAYDTLRLPVQLVDRFGVASVNESVYRVEVRQDRPPEASVTLPESDIDVLPTAVVPVRVEARDDIALRSVAAEHALARRRAGSTGASPEPLGESVTLAAATPSDANVPTRTLTSEASLNLATLGAIAGDEVWVRAVAVDAFALDDRRHEPVKSGVRRLRVISPDQLNEQLWGELSALRRSAVQTSERQTQATESLTKAPQPPGDAQVRSAAREQARVTDAVERMAQALTRARERAQRAIGQAGEAKSDATSGTKPDAKPDAKAGAASDPVERDVREALDAAQELLRRAREASSSASAALQQAQQAQQDAQSPNAPQQAQQEAQQQAQQAQEQAQRARQEARAAQQQAQDRLDELAAALDRGQDAFAQRRAVERLLREQQELREQTARLGEATRGRSSDELTPEQRERAEQIARQQEQLAQRSQDAIKDLERKAAELQSTDPSTSSALRQAAQRAQRQNIPEPMQRAAQQVRRNQQQSAQQQQERAEQSLKQVLDELRESSRDRDSALRRQLASLAESIEALIAQQEGLIARTTALVDQRASAIAGLDQDLLRLSTSTLAAVDLARAGGREARAVVDAFDQAVSAQGDGVSALRPAAPASPDLIASRDAQQQSLKHLRAALDETNKAQQQAAQRERQQKHQELRQQYRQLLERQAELRKQAQGVAQMPADRRRGSVARQVGAEQEALRESIGEVLTKTDGLRDSELFEAAHQRMDEAARDAAQRLANADAGAVVLTRQQSVARTLQSLIDALDDAQQQDDFRQNEQGNQSEQQGEGGGGQQQEPLIADLAELRALKLLQENALATTREAADAKDPALVQATTREAAQWQALLAKRGEALIKKIEQQQGGGAPGGGGGGGGGPPRPTLPDVPGQPSQPKPPDTKP
jgi:hypothetical protein